MRIHQTQAERKGSKLTTTTVSKLSDYPDLSDRSDLIRQHTPLNRCHRLPCKLIERRHAHLKMLFLRILDFIVADAVETLYEHHHRRNAGSGDFGSVVEWTRGKSVGFAAGFGNGIRTHLDEVGIEKDRFDLPDAFP